MIRHDDHLQGLVDRYGIGRDDILLIALNACGIASAGPARRMRFNFEPEGRAGDPIFLIPSFDRLRSPFCLNDQSVRLNDVVIGHVDRMAPDDVSLGYFRNGFFNLTLNSNARSACTGCMFCFTGLEPAADPKLTVGQELQTYFAFLKDDLGWDDFSDVGKITVCSGCFQTEERAIAHMELLAGLAREVNFRGELHLLTSVIRSRAGLKRVASRLSPFHLTLTIECFDRRDEILKRSKADMNFDEMLRILETAREFGIKTDYTLLVGLDSLDTAIPRLEQLLSLTSTFPRLQIYQPHNTYQAAYRCPESDDIEFYLRFRKAMEVLFAGTTMRPFGYENYRPLWYYTFDGQPTSPLRI